MNKETREGRYMEDPSLGFETRAAQAGGRTRIGDTVSTVGPIAASTTFTYDSVDEIHEALATGGEGFAYSRNANPTVDALEAVLASLEGTDSVVAFGSGMAAMHAALLSAGLETGDSVLVASDLYGVTRSLMVHLQQFGIDHASIDILNLAEVERALERTGARVLSRLWTTPSPRRTCFGPRKSAWTWWFTVPPNTSQGMATSRPATSRPTGHSGNGCGRLVP
jgi:O-acetylhomoserine/O-acetylserine sulfhydrylase-like pyridoxal-dependent enzyme